MAFSEFYDDLARLDEVDWSLMRAQYWADTNDDLDRKRRRQAEFLVHQRFPVALIYAIGVMDRQRQAETQTLLATRGLTIPVSVQPGWYY